jgi:hypothetical protein
MVFVMEAAIKHIYEVRPRSDNRGFDLSSDVLPFGKLWYDTPDNASATPCTAVVHMTLWFAFTTMVAT